ncbi:hypothetical protein J1N35_042842 [Gossypium stocksii]|uniref:Uncharacterized protein n=1 Tax=Gossypium stocksii TaxID=47602 RepID=A0A9D3ZEV2_9ROSI|nr:hypothetical protein J1N35_042842 [Gossypium stocksii]
MHETDESYSELPKKVLFFHNPKSLFKVLHQIHVKLISSPNLYQKQWNERTIFHKLIGAKINMESATKITVKVIKKIKKKMKPNQAENSKRLNTTAASNQ